MDKAEQIADQLVQRGRIEVGRELVDLIERIERNTGTAAATAAVAEADFKRLLEQHRELELAGKDALERLAAEVRGQLQKQGPLSETRKSVIEDLAVKAGGGFLAAALKQLLLGP
jgi:polyhydroxyalkanoate synthesis regulator phasin